MLPLQSFAVRYLGLLGLSELPLRPTDPLVRFCALAGAECRGGGRGNRGGDGSGVCRVPWSSAGAAPAAVAPDTFPYPGAAGAGVASCKGWDGWGQASRAAKRLPHVPGRYV